MIDMCSIDILIDLGFKSKSFFYRCFLLFVSNRLWVPSSVFSSFNCFMAFDSSALLLDDQEAAKALAERMIHVEYWVRVLYFRIQRAKPPPLPTSTAPPSEFIGDCPHVDVPHVDVAEDEEAISVVQDGS